MTVSHVQYDIMNALEVRILKKDKSKTKKFMDSHHMKRMVLV